MCSPISSIEWASLPQRPLGQNPFDDTYGISEADYSLIESLSNEDKVNLLPILRFIFPPLRHISHLPPPCGSHVYDNSNCKKHLQSHKTSMSSTQYGLCKLLGGRRQDNWHQPVEDKQHITNNYLLKTNRISNGLQQIPSMASFTSVDLPQYPVLASSDCLLWAPPCKQDSGKSLQFIKGGLYESQQPWKGHVESHDEQYGPPQVLALNQKCPPYHQVWVEQCQQTLSNAVTSNQLAQMRALDMNSKCVGPHSMMIMTNTVSMPATPQRTDFNCQTLSEQELTENTLYHKHLHTDVMELSRDDEYKDLHDENCNFISGIRAETCDLHFNKGRQHSLIEDIKRSVAESSTGMDIKLLTEGPTICLSSPISPDGSRAAWNHVQTPPNDKPGHWLYETEELYGSPPSLESGGEQDIHSSKCSKNDGKNRQLMFLESEEGNLACASSMPKYCGKLDSQTVNSVTLLNTLALKFPEASRRKRTVAKKVVGWIRKQRSSQLSMGASHECSSHERSSHERFCRLPCCTQIDCSRKRKRLSAHMPVTTKSPMSYNSPNATDICGKSTLTKALASIIHESGSYGVTAKEALLRLVHGSGPSETEPHISQVKMALRCCPEFEELENGRFVMKKSIMSCAEEAENALEDLSTYINMKITKKDEAHKLKMVAGPENSDFGRCRKTDSKLWRCTNKAKVGLAYCEHHLMQQIRLRKRSRQALSAKAVHSEPDTKANAHLAKGGRARNVTSKCILRTVGNKHWSNVTNKSFLKVLGNRHQEAIEPPMTLKTRRMTCENMRKLDDNDKDLERLKMTEKANCLPSNSRRNWLGLELPLFSSKQKPVVPVLRGVNKHQDVPLSVNKKGYPILAASKGSEMQQNRSAQLERCHKTDGRQWHCSELCIIGSNYCQRHGSSKNRRKM